MIHFNLIWFFLDAPDSICSSKQVVRTAALELAPNLFEYQGCKFSFDPTIGKYSCSLCGCSNKRKTRLYSHIQKEHFNSGKFKILDRAGELLVWFASASSICYVACNVFSESANLENEPKAVWVYHSSMELAPNLFEYRGHKFTFDPATRQYCCSLCEYFCMQKEYVYGHIRKLHLNRGGNMSGESEETSKFQLCFHYHGVWLAKCMAFKCKFTCFCRHCASTSKRSFLKGTGSESVRVPRAQIHMGTHDWKICLQPVWNSVQTKRLHVWTYSEHPSKSWRSKV